METAVIMKSSVLMLCILFLTNDAKAHSLKFTKSKTRSSGIRDTARSCPCIDSSWCEPIATSNRKEIFAFSVKNDSSYWSKYDWSKLTTVVMVGYVSDELMCMAHALNTAVSYIADIKFDFTNAQLRQRWIHQQVQFMQDHFLDGINFDYEGEIFKYQKARRDGYTSLVAETNSFLKKIFPHSQVTVDVPWKENIDQRYYDFKGLADSSDFLFVMAYDEQSQIFGKCIALPNSGFYNAVDAVNSYLGHQIPADKLVLGVPWYGYVYDCIKVDGDTCYIRHVPFRGVNCSDGAGRQMSYADIEVLAKDNNVKWNTVTSTPFFTYMDHNWTQTHQVQYDNTQSLLIKYNMALKMNLRGVGFWNIDALNYNDTSAGLTSREKMFEALPEY